MCLGKIVILNTLPVNMCSNFLNAFNILNKRVSTTDHTAKSSNITLSFSLFRFRVCYMIIGIIAVTCSRDHRVQSRAACQQLIAVHNTIVIYYKCINLDTYLQLEF